MEKDALPVGSLVVKAASVVDGSLCVELSLMLGVLLLQQVTPVSSALLPPRHLLKLWLLLRLVKVALLKDMDSSVYIVGKRGPGAVSLHLLLALLWPEILRCGIIECDAAIAS